MCSQHHHRSGRAALCGVLLFTLACTVAAAGLVALTYLEFTT